MLTECYRCIKPLLMGIKALARKKLSWYYGVNLVERGVDGVEDC
ncbi:hypothetical protein PECL_18 [Pediococcus claussenii ATCC BAA-344]|uniref:Uncharacterized protein n=1 Tax=Pediococcus claussenii (strain ATCC BAA-344 / DSM 14800 / JCM 18046 / KCTC 3811 / LMG 21948 / P06) TaxID=701521 RepID=G8PE95_PEDCP|nr:hypothetical protein PECL_18 [Pediococcus claussenii ATCC BAA-344]